MDNVSYYGCGPYENYSDKHHSCWIGRFNTTADEMFEDYIKPQENGSRHGCREITVENSVLGLKVEKLNKMLAFNLSHYTQEELTQKTHNYQLEKSEYMVTLSAADYIKEENSVKVTVSVETEDGYRFLAEKTVEILDEHVGGTATCTDKAKCEICGAEYGELDANHHVHLNHVEGKKATKKAEGNKEYWYCEACSKYFADAHAAKEIKKADTVIAKLKDNSKSAKTGDSNNLALWFVLLGISGCALTSTSVLKKKRKK